MKAILTHYHLINMRTRLKLSTLTDITNSIVTPLALSAIITFIGIMVTIEYKKSMGMGGWCSYRDYRCISTGILDHPSQGIYRYTV